MTYSVRTTSGIATMSKEIVLGTCHHFNWFQLGAAIKHPEKGKLIEINQAASDETGVPDPNIRIMPIDGYGNQQLVREIMQIEKPDGILFYTDPRQWQWLIEQEHEIRQHIPMIYYNVWDAPPPPHFNEQIYESCDTILNISKQTHNLVKIVLGDGNYEEIY